MPLGRRCSNICWIWRNAHGFWDGFSQVCCLELGNVQGKTNITWNSLTGLTTRVISDEGLRVGYIWFGPYVSPIWCIVCCSRIPTKTSSYFLYLRILVATIQYVCCQNHIYSHLSPVLLQPTIYSWFTHHVCLVELHKTCGYHEQFMNIINMADILGELRDFSMFFFAIFQRNGHRSQVLRGAAQCAESHPGFTCHADVGRGCALELLEG